MTRRLVVAVALAIASSIATAHAGTVAVSGPVNGRLLIEADDATVDELLARLAQHQGFKVDGTFQASASRRIWGKIQGDLDTLLRRLLRAENFTIVYSSSAPSGVARVVLSGAGSGMVAAAGVTAPAQDAASSPALAKPSSAGRMKEPTLPTAIARGDAPGAQARSELALAIQAKPSPGPSEGPAWPSLLSSELSGAVPSATVAVVEGILPSATLPASRRGSTSPHDAVPSVVWLAEIEVPSARIGGFQTATVPR